MKSLGTGQEGVRGNGKAGREVRIRGGFSEGTDFQPTWDCEKSWWWGRGEVFQLSCKSEACFFLGREKERELTLETDEELDR